MKKVEIKCKGADTLPIDRILDFQGGLKTLSKGNEKKLRNSILKFGFIAPFFVWDDHGELKLLDGHQRLKTLLKMREEGYDIPLLPVDYIEADSEEDAKRKLLHITSQYGEFSPEGFENFTLDLDGFENIRLTDGEFDISFLRDKDEAKDDNYEIPDEIETDIKVGDVFQIGEHRLMCGDSTDAEMVAKLMDGQKADMVFTDPPYNVDYSNADRPKPSKHDLGKIENDVMGEEEFYNFLVKVYKRLDEATKDDCSFYIWYADKSTISFYTALRETAIKFNQLIIWKKPMLLGRSRYQWAHEPCIFAVKGSPHFTDDRTKTTVWDFGGYDKSKNVHPTQKPLFLPSEAISNSSKKGETVLDLFGGSGSTLIACEQLNRTCYMMELDPKYCHVIIDRMRELDGTIEIRRNGELYD